MRTRLSVKSHIANQDGDAQTEKSSSFFYQLLLGNKKFEIKMLKFDLHEKVRHFFLCSFKVPMVQVQYRNITRVSVKVNISIY